MRRIGAATTLAVTGLVFVLAALTAIAVVQAVRSRAAAADVKRAAAVAKAYDGARYAVSEEESLERKYRLEPGPEIAARWRAAGRDLVAALQRARVLERGEPDDTRLVEQVLAAYGPYVDATEKMFAAVDAHRPALVLAIDGGQVDPKFSVIETLTNGGAERHRADADASVAHLRAFGESALRQTAIAFGIGLALLAIFAGALIQLRRRADAARRGAEQSYRTLVESLPLVTYIAALADDGGSFFISPQIEALVGYPRPTRAQFRELVHPDDRAAVRAVRESFADAGQTYSVEYRLVGRDGRSVWVHDEGKLERVPETGELQLRGYLVDVTARREAEAAVRERDQQLRQAQKLEAVGRLAGGIAHDFNNLLTVIIGSGSLLRRAVADRPEAELYVTEIADAADRAATLTNQLLVFSRRNVVETQVLSLAAAARDMEKMLRRLVAENIVLAVRSDGSDACIEIDAGQLEQVILNLVVNAQDAMPAGGALEVLTGTVESADPKTGVVQAYARLLVSDTGTGMSEDTLPRIFEPFFTTKETGKGTGLGLSTVYGIVEEGGGFVTVESREGRGTTFAVFLPLAQPAHEEGTGDDAEPESSPSPRAGTVLLVEDEEAVRRLTAVVLREAGYRVLEAVDGADALAVAESEPAIDLVVSDVIMPRLGGTELLTRLAAERPELTALLTSGYTADAELYLDRSPRRAFLQKPYTVQELLDRVHSLIAAA